MAELRKNKKLLLVLLALLLVILIIYIFNIPLPFRYNVTGTNEGFIYKTDRLTGRTWIIGPNGEREIKPLQPSPTPKPPVPFPVSYLEILTNEAIYKEFYGDRDTYAKVVIRNTHKSDANEINFKIDYYELQNGPIIDTSSWFEHRIRAGDTESLEIRLDNDVLWEWYKITIESAVY